MVNNKPSLLLMVAGQKGHDFVCDLLNSLNESADIKAIVSYEQEDLGKGFAEIRRVADSNDIRFHATRRPSQELLNSVNLVFLVGWQYLIPDPTNRIIAIHDSLLPRYRGFSPTVNALINGETTIGVSAFVPNNEVDAGEVLAQESVDVSHPIRLQDALQLLRSCYVKTAAAVIEQWSTGTLNPKPQREDQATYSIWRDDDDFRIDWNDSAEKIRSFVFAVGFPYSGALSTVEGNDVRVLELEIVDDLVFEIRHPGKIWKLDLDGPIVVCGTGMVKLTSIVDHEGRPYHPSRLKLRFT